MEINAKLIDEKLKAYYESKVKILPRYTHWASICGHPCTRYLTLLRTQWQEIKGLSADIQPRLETGMALHKQAEQTFRNAGFNVFTSPDPLRDDDLQVSGRMDIEISLDKGKAIPVEVKSMENYALDRFNTAEDFLKSKWYYKNYLAQISLYCYMRNKDKGILHLRSLRRWKNIDISILDKDIVDFVTAVIEKLKFSNEHIQYGTLPHRISYDDSICGKCNAKHICVPDEPISNGEVMIDEELENMLERREELKSSTKEYAEIDKAVKSKVKERPRVVIGNFDITGKWQDRKEFTVKAGKNWVTTIKKLASFFVG